MKPWTAATQAEVLSLDGLTIVVLPLPETSVWLWALHRAGRGLTAGQAPTQQDARIAALTAALHLAPTNHHRMELASLLAQSAPPLSF